MARDFFFEITTVDQWRPNEPNSIGGTPWLPSCIEWPHCKQCDERLTFLLQFTIDESFGVPLRPGSHFLAFACWQHDDIADLHDTELPSAFWTAGAGHYQMILARPDEEKRFLERDDRVSPHRIEFARRSESIKRLGRGYDIGADCAKVGGVPCWAQEPERYICGCGAPMEYFAMLAEYFEFPTVSGAPVQPHGTGDDHYLLFLGNANYFMACSRQCSPFAVLTLMQN
jgi:hypothetical protein